MDSSDHLGHHGKQIIHVKKEVKSQDESNLMLPSPTVRFRRARTSITILPDNRIIYLGQSFTSFSEVSKSVRKYELAHKVCLSQKYFRRIAANPKPSNKDDYILTVDERKRFLYRWVDFCCTYFDELHIKHGDNQSEGGDESSAFGYAIKECPMRIRFQMRPKEKDITVSIFRESHDHEPPLLESEDDSNSSLAKGGVNCDIVNSHESHRHSLRPPPSLAPIPNSTVGMRKPTASNSNSINSVIQKSFLPKPPPLKKGSTSLFTRTAPPHAVPMSSHDDERTGEQEDRKKVDLPAETIINNVYSYLRRTLTNGSNMRNGIVLTSPNPNIIKLTSDLCGVDEKAVIQARGTNSKRANQEITTNMGNHQCHISTTSSSVNMRLNGKRNGSIGISSIPKRLQKTSTNSGQRKHLATEFQNEECVDLPLEVVIKAELDDEADDDDGTSSYPIYYDGLFDSRR